MSQSNQIYFTRCRPKSYRSMCDKTNHGNIVSYLQTTKLSLNQSASLLYEGNQSGKKIWTLFLRSFLPSSLHPFFHSFVSCIITDLTIHSTHCHCTFSESLLTSSNTVFIWLIIVPVFQSLVPKQLFKISGVVQSAQFQVLTRVEPSPWPILATLRMDT